MVVAPSLPHSGLTIWAFTNIRPIVYNGMCTPPFHLTDKNAEFNPFRWKKHQVYMIRHDDIAEYVYGMIRSENIQMLQQGHHTCLISHVFVPSVAGERDEASSP